MDSSKTPMLEISFKTDSLIDYFMRVNVIVTEKKDMFGNV